MQNSRINQLSFLACDFRWVNQVVVHTHPINPAISHLRYIDADSESLYVCMQVHALPSPIRSSPDDVLDFLCRSKCA